MALRYLRERVRPVAATWVGANCGSTAQRADNCTLVLPPDEIMLADDDDVRYSVGECFAHLLKDDAESRVEAMKAKVRPSRCGVSGHPLK